MPDTLGQFRRLGQAPRPWRASRASASSGVDQPQQILRRRSRHLHRQPLECLREQLTARRVQLGRRSFWRTLTTSARASVIQPSPKPPAQAHVQHVRPLPQRVPRQPAPPPAHPDHPGLPLRRACPNLIFPLSCPHTDIIARSPRPRVPREASPRLPYSSAPSLLRSFSPPPQPYPFHSRTSNSGLRPLTFSLSTFSPSPENKQRPWSLASRPSPHRWRRPSQPSPPCSGPAGGSG